MVSRSEDSPFKQQTRTRRVERRLVSLSIGRDVGYFHMAEEQQHMAWIQVPIGASLTIAGITNIVHLDSRNERYKANSLLLDIRHRLE